MNIKMLKAAVAGLVLSVSGFANAGLITSEISTPDSIIDFSQFGSFNFTSGPIEIGSLVGESILWSSTNNGSVIGNGGYGLDSNGRWDNMNGYIGLNTSSGSMSIDFSDGPIQEFSLLANYAPGFGEFFLEAYGLGGILLESYNISSLAAIVTNTNNTGEYRGISRMDNDIYSIRLSNAYVVADNLSFSRVEVPEPTTLAIFALGLMGLAARRFKKQ
ncbi:MAG: PEP-CTERM sorting domain-containing protein [Colwellia sp.]|nr:PEP-CTERM sorting domain-containing protein [Colwellia sp.]